MMWKLLQLAAILVNVFDVATALSNKCSKSLGAGTAVPGEPFWMQNMVHRGTSAFNPDTGYQVFRNVKDFGAKGDGVTDDTAAISLAMSSGNRCGEGTCASSTLTPAIVYFPQGTYLVSSPIVAWYYTQIIGDARTPPTLLAAADFTGAAVIDADPYIPNGGGAQWYVNQDNFYRSVRNFVIDLTQMPATAPAVGLHWQVSQATSLMNIVVHMSTTPGNTHEGLYMENGSGGFMGDLIFNGGNYGISGGNQQFTVRNLTVNNANVAVNAAWSWGWTYQGVTISNCQVGFALTTSTSSGTQAVGAEVIVDAVVTNTPIFVQTSTTASPINNATTSLGGSIYLNNIRLNNVPIAVGVLNGATILHGGSTTIASWAQGNIYSGTNPNPTFVQKSIPAPYKPSVLTDGNGRIFGKTHPQYASYDVSQFVSVKQQGAKGDGQTDDTAAIKRVLAEYAECKIIFFDAGTYIVTSTITIPAGTQIVGEAWSVLMGTGSAFENMNNPQPVFKVGNPGDHGTVEITDIVFTTRGPTPGAIVVEWNVHDPAGQQGAAGMWDTHFRLGGAAGTNLESSCGLNPSTTGPCFAAFMGLHLTPSSSVYLEGTWIWLADHDLDGDYAQFGAYSGRGIYSESQGPVWMIGTAEHHTLYQYNLANAQNHYMGLIQTETAYYQPDPAPPAPFKLLPKYNDPTSFNGGNQGWGLSVKNSHDILIFGAGLYSFFNDWSTSCSPNCQQQIVDIDSVSSISIYSLSNVDVVSQLSVGGKAIIPATPNADGTADTVTAWTSGR